MIVVRTYLKTDDQFIDIDEFQGELADDRYIVGAIELSIDGLVLIDKSFWDLIEQLWSYLLAGMTSILEGKPYRAYFPDHPVPFQLTPDLERRIVEMSMMEGLERVAASAPLGAFVSEMAREARRFYERLHRLLPQNAYRRQFAQLQAIERACASLK